MALQEIGVKLTLDGEQEYNAAMKAAKDTSASLKSEMALVSAEFAENAKSADALRAKGELLARQEQNQAEKVAALQKHYEEVTAAKGKDAAESKKLERSLNYETAALLKAQKATEDNAKALGEAERPSVRLKDSLQQLRKRLDDMPPAAKEAGKGLKLTGEAAAAAAKLTGKLTAAAGAAVGALAVIGGAGISKVAGWAKEAAEAEQAAAEAAAAAGEAYNPGKYAAYAKNLTALTGSAAKAKEALGGLLLPALEGLSGKGAAWLDDFSTAMEKAGTDTAAQSTVISEYITKGVDLVRDELPELMKLGTDLIGSLGKGIQDNLPEILDAGKEALTTLLDGIEENADDLAAGAVEIVSSLVGFLMEEAPDLIVAGFTIIGQLAVGLVQAIPTLIREIPTMLQKLAQGFRDNKEQMKGVGKDIIAAILDGLKQAWEGVKSWFKNAFKGLRGNVEVGTQTVSRNASGLPFVPTDNFPALLHRGEAVLTAAEAAEYRRGAVQAAGSSVTVNVYPQRLDEAETQRLVNTIDAAIGGRA